jgi:hypothetical protein
MTTDAVVLSFLFIHIGVILVVTAYFTLGAAVAPGLTERARVRFARRPWLPLLLGVGVSVPWVIASLVLLKLNAAPAKLAGAVLGCTWILAGLVGGSGLAQHVGRGAGGSPPTLMHTVRGGLLISLTWVLPIVGWLGMLPLTLATGVGCLLLGLVPARRPVPPPVPA